MIDLWFTAPCAALIGTFQPLENAVIATKYLLYLGSSTDPLAIKTARGVAHWRPQHCVGQMSRPGCSVTLGLPELSFAEARAQGARTMLIGLASAGGALTDAIAADALAALEAGLNVASGLHGRLSARAELRRAADERGLALFDVRDPPAALDVGTGRLREGNRLLTVGSDCAVGKMYTTLALERQLRADGVEADFRATGQTGIFIAGDGVPVDAVVADFISGSIERLSPARHDGGWDLIEGQGSLFHPSYAGVSLGLLHGAQPDALVLCHEAGRTQIRHLQDYTIPSLRACLDRNLDLARLTNPGVVAVGVSLNTSALSREGADRLCGEIEQELGLPCQDPLVHGVARITERLCQCFPPSR